MAQTEKREVSTLIPYFLTVNREALFFMQIRDEDAPRLPGYLGFFGGGVEEGESPTEALKREIKEELALDLTDEYSLFSRYEALHTVNNVYLMQIAEDFASTVTVHEGEGGKFVSARDIQDERKICDSDRLILIQLSKTLKGEETW
jgi:8-oxo-dGTP pyrophosphatase MutT (NUDIX family)